MKQAAAKQGMPAERGRGKAPEPFFTPLQTKLNVSRPGEKLEQEADHAADAVVHGRGPMAGGVRISEQVSPIAQRSEEEAQAACESRESDPLWHQHEPASDMRPGDVADEPLQMMAEPEAQKQEEGEEEELQAREEDAQAVSEQEEAVQAQEEEEAVQSREEETQRQPEEEEEPVQAASEADAQLEAEEKEDLQARDEEAQRQSEEEEEPVQARDEAQRQPETEEEEPVQMRAARPALSPRALRLNRVETQLRASRGRGNPLPEGVRRKMEQGLGADFSGVRIHTDHPAFLMTRLLNAKAFTSGRDIYFSPHRFSPGSQDGDHLLAHELAHTLHQAAVPVREDTVAQRVFEENQQQVRPETLEALRIAYSYEGKINSNFTDETGERIGWEQLKEVFHGAFDRDLFPDALMKRPLAHPQDLPHWCGIFAWSALRRAGVPLPPWSLGMPMLKHTQLRPAGELPQVGDIAYRDKLPWMPEGSKLTHHQALVSAVESHETAKAADFSKIKVTTIDGNTAGSNNMGGQVQETTQPIGYWKHFFDPVGKVDMPSVPLVTIDRSAPDLGASEAAKEDSLQEDAPATDVAGLEQEVSASEEAMAGPEAEVAVDLDLPPVVEAQAEPAAKVEKVALVGKSDEATASYTRASPSSMAITAPDLGATLDRKTQVEKKQVAEETPKLKAETGGAVDPAITAPDQIPVPEDVTLKDEGQGAEVGDLEPGPHTDKGEAPSTANTTFGRQMKQNESSGGFLDWLRKSFASFLSAIRVRDDGVTTTAGPRQRVALTGDADTGRMGRQREEGTAKLRQERDAKAASFKAHPGQSNIQPRKVDQDFKSEQAPQTSEPVKDMEVGTDTDDYAKAQWPADFRGAADAKMAKKLDGSMSKARGDVETAGSARDAEKDAAIADAEARTAAANTSADGKQREAVVAGRSDAARQQGEAVQGAYDGVAEFSKDAAGEQTTKGKAIAADVKDSEGKADKDLADGEKKADGLKTTAESDAKTEKAEIKKKESDDSWWGKLTKAIVNKITSAIDSIFTAMRAAVKKALDAAKKWAVEKINAARNRAIKALNGFRDWAKDKVNTYVKDRYPGLAKALNDGIDKTVDVAVAGVNAAADGAIATVEKLADALAGALDKLLEKFQAALKAVVKVIGAALRGDFVGALKIAFEAACELAGVNPKPILDFLERAGQKILSILKSPGPFINNLFRAVGMGLRNFADNFVQHFKTGVISWLTGTLSAVPITLPTKWDIKGFFSLMAQILGLTYENIKARIILKFPKAAGIFAKIEAGWKFVKMLLDKDYAGLWEEVKAKLASLRDTILGAIRNWTLLNVIKQGIMWLLSMLNPASAIVRLLKMLADLVFWLIDNIRRIKDFVLSVYGAISNIAAGILKPAAKAVENALARALPIVLSFIASALGLGDIAGAIQGVITKIQAPVNKAIDALIDRVVAFARKLIAKIVGGAKKAGKKAKDAAMKLIRWWTEKRPFRSKDGGDHKIYYKGEGTRADLWIASTPSAFQTFIAAQMKSDDKAQAKLAKEANRIYVKQVLKSEERMDKLQAERKAIGSANKDAYRKKQGELQTEIRNFRTQLLALSGVLKQMNIDDVAAARTKVTYTDAGHKQVTALPLTFIPGDEKGSSPSEDPPGYDYARRINTAEGKTVWIRGHLLNDNVHGPGKARNMVPIPQSTNRLMESKAESDLKRRVHSQKEQLYFRATATFWPSTKEETRGFPKKLVLVWHKAEKKDGTWKKGPHISKALFDSPKPPDNVNASIPGITSGSSSQLVSAINTQSAGLPVTTHFVGILKEQASYADAAAIRTKLTTTETSYTALNPSQKENRGKQIYRTIAAVNAKKINLS
ncbi:DUF4157 domain-containing protein [Tropicimonas sp. TH_r6]|uniref:eCIS core domain-containing protein n=1 Tax=Tropicimonas sp. TH_r6 TaxID=3082085 RepID=UPI00295409FC|nr:DUF4157 domain-containing protein [Tropicimonas sp. TH_r6]MDV7144024.1 DUF4157 domain-containing protein [Tropicimonas sp. TH_r6]